MRLTTKIILGIILSIFTISLLFIIGFSFTGRRNFERSNYITTDIPQNNITGISLKPYRVIVLDTERTDNTNDYTYGFGNDQCGLFLNPKTTDKENDLFIPEALNRFISTQTDNDTLTIKIKIDELRNYYIKDNIKKHAFFTGINLYLYTSDVNVINKINNIQTKINDIETDSIKIDACGDIFIDSCKALVIEPVLENNYHRLTVRNCTIKSFHLDMDRIQNWNIENCNIEEENLTGSKKHSITKKRKEPGKINWLPKNNEARLNVTIQGDTTQIIFQ